MKAFKHIHTDVYFTALITITITVTVTIIIIINELIMVARSQKTARTLHKKMKKTPLSHG